MSEDPIGELINIDQAYRELQARMDGAIDTVLDVLDEAATDGIEIDPLATIIDRVKARGAEIDLSTAPPIMQMLLSGMLDG